MIRGRVNPLFKTPRVVLSSNFTTIQLGLLVSGGCTRVIGSYNKLAGEYQVIVDLTNNNSEFVFENISDQEQEVMDVIRHLISIYGIIDVEPDANFETITVEGYTLSVADAYELDDSPTNFEHLGLCEGVISIYDEESESLLGNAIWHNGKFYVPISHTTNQGSFLADGIEILESALDKPLAELLASNTYLKWSNDTSYTFEDLMDVLSDSGLEFVKLPLEQSVERVADFPAILLLCDPTQLWLNG